MLRQGGQRTLTLVVSTGPSRERLAESIDIVGTSDWSPDGQWVVVGGDDGNGRGLFKIPVDGGEPIRLMTGRHYRPDVVPGQRPHRLRRSRT